MDCAFATIVPLLSGARDVASNRNTPPAPSPGIECALTVMRKPEGGNGSGSARSAATVATEVGYAAAGKAPSAPRAVEKKRRRAQDQRTAERPRKEGGVKSTWGLLIPAVLAAGKGY